MLRKISKERYIPLGIISDRDTIGIFALKSSILNSHFQFLWSEDGTHFTKSPEKSFIYLRGKKENPHTCSNFRFSRSINGWIATYTRTIKNTRELAIALSLDLKTWTVVNILSHTHEAAPVMIGGKHANYGLYAGGLFAKVFTSKDAKQWDMEQRLVFTSRHDHFDRGNLIIMGAFPVKDGTLVLYDASYTNQDASAHMLQVGGMLFSKDDPTKIIWRSDIPLWQGLIHQNSGIKPRPLGVAFNNQSLSILWATDTDDLITARIAAPFIEQSVHIRKGKTYLKKHHKNPVIEPKSDSEWQSDAVFNPAAIYDNGKVHLLYRAMGKNGVSVLGYASSVNGLDFTTRLDEPVYEPTDKYCLDKNELEDLVPRSPRVYASGGGWHGCEDPRAVKIGKRVYVTYLAFNGWDSMRLAITSISERDLHNHHWNWAKPTYISAPGEIHKNWVMFPEKINGKFAILHTIAPKVQIHYIDSLKSFDGNTFIQSQAPSGGRTEFWDTKVRGAGPPPIKTKLGWLLLYHANDKREPHKYKLGAMILDSKNPEKILYRTTHPVLVPEECYENNGKPGIIYASGALIKDGLLYVYYGGADRVVCVATAPVDEFLEKIKKDVEIKFNKNRSHSK